jgi:hypothetical protein
MKSTEKQTGRSRYAKVLRVHDFNDEISPREVPEIFSERGRVGAVRIVSGGKETVVSFEMHEMRLDDDLSDPVIWNGMEIYFEEGWY